MKPSSSQRGQASVELAGLLLLAGLLIAAALATASAPAAALPRAIARAILPQPGNGAAPERPAPVAALIGELMAGDLDSFLAYRDSPAREERLDFSTDGCSAPVLGDSGPAFDFGEACLRHDFGYRNYGPIGALDERRRHVDEVFLADMRGHCVSRPPAEILRCLRWALTYYRGVRAFGWIPARRYEGSG